VLSFGVFAKDDFLIATRGETLRGKSKPCAQLVADSSYALRSQVSVGTARNPQSGMTLMELIIVVALLSIVALASVSLIVDTGEWKRQQATEEQWLSVKRSILGDNVVDVHHFREYSGFVADMGRLPNCLRELIRPFDCEPDLSLANRLTAFTQDIDSNQWYGWRGPYLGVPGANEYRDGWRNRGRDDNTGNDDDVNYGWLFGTGAPNGTECQNADVEQQQPGAIILQSCGDDGDVDNTETGFQGDYPYAEADGTYIPLVTRHDYQVDIGASWLNVPVKVKSKTIGSSKVIPANDLRLRVNYPIGNGSMPDWSDAILANGADRDDAPFLSATFPVSATRFVDGTGKVYTDAPSDTVNVVPSATILSSTEFSTIIEIPNAVSSALVFEDNSVLMLQDCPCELRVEPPLAVSGTQTSLVVDTIAIKPDNIAPMTADLGEYVIELPQAATENSLTSFTLPNGATLTFSRPVDDAYSPKMIWDITGAQPTVTVSEPFTLVGDLVETNSGDQFLVPSTSTAVGNVITITKAVPSIPQGLRNITIVCESDGFLFDGDCSDNASAYSPIAIPYQLEVSPRSYIPVPDEIVWDIQ
jgi:prepilin-type N-terminal cleavage/methylation domain-containing protein